MPQYLISFPGEAMDVPDDEMAAVAEAADAVVEQARAAGVLLCAGGLMAGDPVVRVAADGTVTDGTYPQTAGFSGGFTVLELPSAGEAHSWASRVAAACRCDQEVRELV